MRGLLQILKRMLLRVGFFLGRINNFLLLTLSFYLLLFPLSLLWRLFWRRKEPSQGWLPRPELPPDHFKRQF